MPLIRGNFAFYLIGQFIALTGDRIATLALVSLAGAFGGGAASAVAAFQILPLILLAYPGGALCDIVSRRAILVGVGLFRTVTVLMFMAIPFATNDINMIFVLVTILGAFAAFFNTAKRSYIPFLVPVGAITEANWYLLVGDVGAMGLGIATGTVLLNYLDADSVLAGVGAMFAISSLVIWQMKPSTDILTGQGGKPKVQRLANRRFRLSDGLQSLRSAAALLRDNPAIAVVLLAVSLPYYAASGLFYAAANYWAVERTPDSAAATFGPMMLALAVGALSSFGIRGILQRIAVANVVSGAFAAAAIGALWLAGVEGAGLMPVIALHLATGVAIGIVYPRTVQLLHLVAPRPDVGKAIGMNEVLGSIAFAGTVAMASILGDVFTPVIGWLGAASCFVAGAAGSYRGLTRFSWENEVRK